MSQEAESGLKITGSFAFDNMLPAGFIVLLGLGFGSLFYLLTPEKAATIGFGLIFILAFIRKIEVPYYITVALLVLLQEAEATNGTVFMYLEKLNRPGIPSLLEVSVLALLAILVFKMFLNFDKLQLGLSHLYLVVPIVMLAVSLVVGFNNNNDNTLLKEDFKRFIIPLSFFVCSLNVLSSKERINKVINAIFVLFFIKSVLALLYYLNGQGFPYGPNEKVVFLESGDQLIIVTTLVVLVSISCSKRITAGRLIFFGIAASPMVFALIFSYRRNAWLGAVASILFLFFLIPSRWKSRMCFILAITGLLLICMLSFSSLLDGLPSNKFLQNRVLSIVDGGQSSNVAHLYEWEVTVKDTMKHPIIGLGLGSEHSEVPGFEGLNAHTVHNAFLMLWMKMGILPVFFFLWILFRYFTIGVRTIRNRSRTDVNALQAGLFATLALWLCAMSVGPSWFYYRETCLMALVAAMVIRLSSLNARPT